MRVWVGNVTTHHAEGSAGRGSQENQEGEAPTELLLIRIKMSAPTFALVSVQGKELKQAVDFDSNFEASRCLCVQLPPTIVTPNLVVTLFTGFACWINPL